MHTALQLSLFWAVAFVTLCAAVVLLNIFYGLIENDLVLHTLGKEAAIAGVASLIEGASLWMLLCFIPAEQRLVAMRALIVPVLMVGLIYKVAHLEDLEKGRHLLAAADSIFHLLLMCILVYRPFWAGALQRQLFFTISDN